VTLSVIYLEFKAHLTSMATTAFCSDLSTKLPKREYQLSAQTFYYYFSSVHTKQFGHFLVL
jgi:hypothetical protein